MSLIHMGLSGSCIILLTAVLRRIALYHLPKRTFAAMWMLAALRMLLPLEVPSKWSAWAFFKRNAAQTVGERVMLQNGAGGAAMPTMEIETSVNWLTILWIVGMVICVLFFLFAWIRSMKRFGGAVPVHSQEVEAFLKEHALRRRVRVCSSGAIAVPMTYGWLRPIILLPERMDNGDIEWILIHEWIHIRRMDVLKKAVLIAVACVHWWNPLAWLMLSLANRDIELACDEQVLGACGNPRDYAMALVSMEEARSFSEPMFSHFSKNQTEERIIAIMKKRNKTMLSMVVSMLLVMCTAAAFATSAPEGENLYAEYEPFGLVYNKSEARLYFDGKTVRYFEDVYPVGDEGEFAGTVVSYSDGEVDVHAVRDLSGDIIRNADGTFDPSGVLTGVEAYSPEEFNSRTKNYEIGESFPYNAQKTILMTGEDGEVEYVETHPIENDGPTSVFISGENGEYTFALNEDQVFYSEGETVSIIGGADGPTAIYVTDAAESPEDGEIAPEMFAEYSAFGLTVQDNALYYEGQRVRQFTDTYKADFFRTVSCEHYDEEGVVDVRAVRDGTKLVELTIAE